MKAFLDLWREYKANCSSEWEKEQARAESVNKANLENGIAGFEFPKKTAQNTPSFEGFMNWLGENYDFE